MSPYEKLNSETALKAQKWEFHHYLDIRASIDIYAHIQIYLMLFNYLHNRYFSVFEFTLQISFLIYYFLFCTQVLFFQNMTFLL